MNKNIIEHDCLNCIHSWDVEHHEDNCPRCDSTDIERRPPPRKYTHYVEHADGVQHGIVMNETPAHKILGVQSLEDWRGHGPESEHFSNYW